MYIVTVLQSETFTNWMDSLRDQRAKDRIAVRLIAAESGHFGDVDSVGDGVLEMRIHYGPGYRVYFIRRGADVIVLLCGGDKASQRRDIRRAKRLALEWRA